MPKASSRDNFVAYVAAAVVVSLVSLFVFTWSHVRTANQIRPNIAYAQFGPFQIETQHFSLTANIAVQTNTSDADWANENRKLLNVIFKKVLADTDVNALRTRNGLQTLQETLKSDCNAEMNTDTVQAVLLTDFVFQVHEP